MDQPHNPLPPEVGRPGELWTLIADLREAHQRLVAANQRLEELQHRHRPSEQQPDR